MVDEEPEGKLLYERKRTRLERLKPHELKPMNWHVVGAVLVAILAIMIGGWHLMQPSEKNADQAVKGEEKPE